MNDRLLSITQTSERTTVPVATLRFYRHEDSAAARRGDPRRVGPKSFRLGGRVVFKESDVEAWIEAQYTAADDPSPAA